MNQTLRPEIIDWAKQLAKAEPNWSAERIAKYMTKGWAFLGAQTKEEHEEELKRIQEVVAEDRK